MEQLKTPKGGLVNVLRNDPTYIQMENITNLTVQLFVNGIYDILMFPGVIKRIKPDSSFAIYDTNEIDTIAYNKDI